MNAAHLHLVFNHLPLACALFGLLLLAWGRARRAAGLHEGALVLFVLGGLLTIPTYVSGEPGEEVVEHLPGVSAALIEDHEEAAGIAAVAAGLLAIAALTALLLQMRRRPVAGWVSGAVVALSLLTAAAMGWTAHLGGRIHHPETRAGASAVSAESAPGAGEQGD